MAKILTQHFTKGEFTMRLHISTITASLASAAILAWPTTASALKDLVIDVNCASGDGIARALDRPNVLDRRMVIVVNGTCAENVVIERDDVTLKAAGSGGGVAPTNGASPAILVRSARRVTLENLAVSGGNYGILATDGAFVTVRGGSVRSAVQHGIVVDDGASLLVDQGTIETNGQTGIFADGARARVVNSNIRGNGLSGVAAIRAGSAVLGSQDAAGNVCCGNLIESNTFDGVTIADSSMATLFGNTIQGNGATNGRFGVLAVHESAAVLRGGNVISSNGSATGGGGLFARSSTIRTGPGDTPVVPSTNEVSGNAFGILSQSNSTVDLRAGASITASRFTGVVVDTGSRLRSDGSTIANNGAHGIFAQRSSGVELVGGANVVSGNTAFGLYCNDGETSYSGSTSGISGNTAGNVSPTCTGH